MNFKVRTFLAGALVFFLAAEGAQATNHGVRVIDGDSLVVSGQGFRLYGIDAPEQGQDCTVNGKAFDCGMVSGTALMDLTAGSKVQCKEVGSNEVGSDHGDLAQEERLARCFSDGYDLSEGMVYIGWALALPESGASYNALENNARDRQHGLWKGDFLEPWIWRERNQ